MISLFSEIICSIRFKSFALLGMTFLVILRRPQADVRIYRRGWCARTAACQVEESMWV